MQGGGDDPAEAQDGGSGHDGDGHVALLPDLLWVEASPAICLRELPDSGYRDIVCSIRAGTSNHPAVKATTSALHGACEEAQKAITANLGAPPLTRRS